MQFITGSSEVSRTNLAIPAPGGQRERVRAFTQAGRAGRVRQALADKSAFDDYDLEASRTKGYGFARIQSYAIEHVPRQTRKR